MKNEKILTLYRTMLRIRTCEESLVDPILSGEIMTPCHLYTGQEAVATGVCEALDRTDYVFGNHRSHGHFLAKGGDMRQLVAEIYCRADGCSRGLGGSMHIIDPSVGMLGAAPIVAGTIALAVGASLASSVRNDGRVTVTFFGDGAAGEGVLYEAMNFAALKKLPIIFACENNFYSTHLPFGECHPEEQSLFRIAEPFGIHSSQVDGNDVIQVIEIAREAVTRCRRGEGPVFLEFLTYRMRGHVGPDDNIQGQHTDIRPAHEIEEWRKRDPIMKLEKEMLDRNHIAPEEIRAIRTDIDAEVSDAHVFARESVLLPGEELKRHVFAS